MYGVILLAAGALAACAAGKRIGGGTVGRPRVVLAGCVLGLILLLAASAALTLATAASAAEGAAAAADGASSGLGFLGASLATGLACLGAGIAVAVVGAAALGVVGEKPSMLGTTLIYLGLAEGIAIYGVIVSLLILGKL
ncbi:MAG: ATP synthase subunit C [Synergistota bacterium]|jgi:V/A-type H+-transporting ATPase subunit K|nr:ATP synthase subunit C [Synergistota bacterium]OPZ39919.1 MAG: V-type ATP synthase subunit K [Synergistetes bacterium ADurb.BinA166]